MHKSTLLFSSLWFLTAATLAGSNTNTTTDSDALAQSRQLQLEFRHGNIEAVKPLVQGLEAAVSKSRNNAELWAAMGFAYMSQQGATLANAGDGPPDFPAMLAIGERARDAFARSLAIHPDDMLIHASHGMAQMVVSLQKQDGPGIMAGVDEMNAAVKQAPKTIGVRLTRAFTIIHLPPAMRDTDAVISDLEFILDSGPSSRPEDVLHLMLGDVHAEMGRLDQARIQYTQVSGASAFAADQVKLRFADLAKGAIPPANIAQVRAVTGSGCATCHAPGKDN